MLPTVVLLFLLSSFSYAVDEHGTVLISCLISLMCYSTVVVAGMHGFFNISASLSMYENVSLTMDISATETMVTMDASTITMDDNTITMDASIITMNASTISMEMSTTESVTIGESIVTK